MLIRLFFPLQDQEYNAVFFFSLDHAVLWTTRLLLVVTGDNIGTTGGGGSSRASSKLPCCCCLQKVSNLNKTRQDLDWISRGFGGGGALLLNNSVSLLH